MAVGPKCVKFRSVVDFQMLASLLKVCAGPCGDSFVVVAIC